MQYKRNYKNIQFDFSIENQGRSEDDILLTTNLTKRPIYQIKNIQQTTYCNPYIIKENQIKKKPQLELQKELFSSRKPFHPYYKNYDSQVFPLINNKYNHLPNFLELSKIIKLTETSRISNKIKPRSKSTDKRFNFHKSFSNKKLQTDTKNIEEQFQETKNLIKRFNRIKRKNVRFDLQS